MVINMSKLVDALGQACPIPVIMTKKEIDNGEDQIITKVDNKIAVENIKKLAATTGFEVEVREDGGLYTVALSKECKECKAMLEELDPEGNFLRDERMLYFWPLLNY